MSVGSNNCSFSNKEKIRSTESQRSSGILNRNDLDRSNSISTDELRSCSRKLSYDMSSNFEENEEIIILLSKKGRKMSNYSNEEGIGFSSRDNILGWCERVLNSISLTTIEKESIFHRFSTAFDFVMEKLYLLHQSIKDAEELKKMVVTIFLLTYKLEGYVIAKITIKSLITAFLKNLKMDYDELSSQIMQIELKILQFIDYDPQLLDNNIHQLSFILFDVMKRKFFADVEGDKIAMIESCLMEMNKEIQFCGEILFELEPLEKAVVSLFAAINVCKEEIEESEERCEEFYNYLKKELCVLKMDKRDIERILIDANLGG